MAEKNIRQIMIDGRLISISGLDEAISSTAKAHAQSSDAEKKEILLQAVSRNNYIAPAAAAAYGRALLREYKTAQGQSVPEEIPRNLTSYVLGAGCTRCGELTADIRNILSEMQIAADLRHLNDCREIAGYGVTETPALVINGKVVSSGVVPPKSQIRQWITEAYSHP